MNSNLSTNQSDNSNTMFGGSSTGTSQTNPFTADLKGEFSSNFGTSTNAVSQIFKEGGFASQGRMRYIIMGVAALLVVGIAAYFLMDSGEEDMEFDLPPPAAVTTKPATQPADVKAEKPVAPSGVDHTAAAPSVAQPTTVTPAEVAPMAGGSGAVMLMGPRDGASLTYDETQGPAEFSWEGGPGGTILFSRDSSMAAVARRVNVTKNSYRFHHPWPGKWYWRVETPQGASEIRSFRVKDPVRRNIQVTSPTAGTSMGGNGGAVSWNGDNKITSYRVELTTGDWTNPTYRFGSAGNSLALQGVSPGNYQLRVGGFSEVSGRWEYTDPVSVVIQ